MTRRTPSHTHFADSQQWVELPTEQRAHLAWEVPFKLQVRLLGEQRVHLKLEMPCKRSVKATLRHLTLEVQVPVTLRLTWESRPGPIAVHVGAVIQETQVQTVDQDMADAEADQDMADVAVVEHPHPHEDKEHAEWDHLVKGYCDEVDRTLDPEQVRAGVEREMAFMVELGVGEPCDRPRTGNFVNLMVLPTER